MMRARTVFRTMILALVVPGCGARLDNGSPATCITFESACANDAECCSGICVAGRCRRAVVPSCRDAHLTILATELFGADAAAVAVTKNAAWVATPRFLTRVDLRTLAAEPVDTGSGWKFVTLATDATHVYWALGAAGFERLELATGARSGGGAYAGASFALGTDSIFFLREEKKQSHLIARDKIRGTEKSVVDLDREVFDTRYVGLARASGTVFQAAPSGLFETSLTARTTVRVADRPSAMVSDGTTVLTAEGSQIVARAPGGVADVVASTPDPIVNLAIDAREFAFIDERRIVQIDRTTGARHVLEGIIARPTAVTFDDECAYIVDAATRSLVRLPR